MAFLLGCEKVSVEFPTKRVLDEVSLGVSSGARVGIVGANGDGKSTLLRVLSGSLTPDSGRVLRSGNISVGVLSQFDTLDNSASVKQIVIGNMPEYEWVKNARVRSIISGLLSDISWDECVENLSGGQVRRVCLAKLLVSDWDVLMLDEPTNHLDMKGIAWLAHHLKTRWKEGQGALLVVTHDRWFLDEVCMSMWEVHSRRIEPFEGGFSAYIMQRVERDRCRALAEKKRQNNLRRELAWLSRGAKARATKPKFHVAAAQALIADVPELRHSLELKRMACARMGKQVIDIEGACVNFDEKQVLSDLDFSLGPGDRVGIVGENGAGKTTLLRTILDKQALVRGRVKIGKTVRFALLSQHLDELAKFGDDKVREVISRYSCRIMLDGKEETPAKLLENLGFSSSDLNEPVSCLSGGQKRRLALMLILLDEPNVLILDEPGNDLDIDMLAAVEDLLDGWPGSLILVTHDRYLMERTTDNQYALMAGKLHHLPRGIDEYLKLCEEEALEHQKESVASSKKSAMQSKGASPGSFRITSSNSAHDTSSSSFESPREKTHLSGGEQYHLRKLMASSERRIETLKTKVRAIQENMAQVNPSDFEALASFQTDIDSFNSQIEELEQAWLEAAQALENA